MPITIPDSLKLMYIRYWNSNGDDFDLIVQAEDMLQAAELWRSYYHTDPSGEVDLDVYMLDIKVAVRELNLSATPGAVDWNGADQVEVMVPGEGKPYFANPGAGTKATAESPYQR